VRKRYAFIIREAIYDVRWDWAGKPGLRPYNFFARSKKEMNLYLDAYNHELDNLTEKELRKTRVETERMLGY